MHSPLSNESGHSALECLSGLVGLDLGWAHGEFKLPDRVHIVDELPSHPPSGDEATDHLLNLYYLPTQLPDKRHDFLAHLLEPKAPLNRHCWVVDVVDESNLVDLLLE